METLHIGAITLPVDAVEEHQIIAKTQDFAEQRPMGFEVAETNQSQSELVEEQDQQLVEDYGDFFQINSMPSPLDISKEEHN